MTSDSEPEELELAFEVGLYDLRNQSVPMDSKLLQAVSLNDIQGVKEMIDAGESVNGIDNSGNSALHLAIQIRSSEMVQLLLKHDVNIDHQNISGFTPLLYTFKHGSIHSIIIQLLEAGCNVNAKNNSEDSALHLAVVNSSPEIVRFMIQHGADINATTKCQFTPLHQVAAYSKNCFTSDIVQLLIVHGADINAQDACLFTPLHQAARWNNLAATCVLLYYNADTTKLCYNGLTPFMYSVMDLDLSEITLRLFPYYDKFTTVAHNGDTAFLMAMYYNNPIAFDLLKSGVNCGFRGTDIGKALCYALDNNAFNLFKLILNDFSQDFITGFQFAEILKHLFQKKNIAVWLDYFYLLVEFGVKNVLAVSHVHNGLILLLNCLRNIDSSKRQCILWAFLTLSIYVEPVEVAMCFTLFGNSDEVEILYQSYNRELCSNIAIPQCVPLDYFNLITYYKSAYVFKMNFEVRYVRYLQALIVKYKAKLPLSNDELYLGYMSFSASALYKLTICSNSNSTSQIIAKLPKEASLLELSRNAAALQLVSEFNIKHPYQFFDIVNRANIPKSVKELLLFRKPVYRI